MNLSRLFIYRPIATLLLMIALVVAGALGYRYLSISALPEVDYPVIQVTTQFPGAGPQVMTSGVTAPLERQLGQMSGLNQMYSVTSGGNSVITLKFNLDLSLDVAEQEVQAAINAADALLPSDLPNKPTYKKVNPADTSILTIAATSDTLPLTKVQDLINTRAALKLSQISGVGLVSLAGGQQQAVRIRANPVKLASAGLALSDINTAINNANVNGSKGGFDGPERSVTIDANDQLKSIEDYQNLVIKYSNGNALRLKDVADVELAPQDEYQEAFANGKPAIIINIQRQPGTNVVNIADDIKAALPAIQESLPGSVKLTILADRTQSIRASIDDVQTELLIAIGLVIAVSFLFLRTPTATLIPSLAVPLSIVGTFAVMYLAGFSLNNLTLMALTIATGFVIDDAIVVVENIQRHIDDGMKPLDAALLGSKEIGFTIVSLTFSLIAVLIPLLFMGDVVGRLFREFSITLAVSILVSMVVSLTLTPMLSAYLLKHIPEEKHSRITQDFGKAFNWLLNLYERCLKVVLNHQVATLFVAIGTLFVTALLWIWVPSGFFPAQDTGFIQGITRAPADISFSEMAKRQGELAALIQKDPGVQSVSSIVGVDAVNNNSLNTGRLQITLKPFGERDSADAIISRLEADAAKVPGIHLYAIKNQDLKVDDQVTPSEYQLTLNTTDQSELEKWVPIFTQALSKRPELKDVVTNLMGNARIAYVDIDREAAARYGLTADDVDTALYNAFGQRLISTIYTQSNQYRVVLEVGKQFRDDLNAFSHIYLKSGTATTTSSASSDSAAPASSTMVPLTSIIRVTEQLGPSGYARLSQTPAATVSFNIRDGYSLDDAKKAIEDVKTQIKLPITMNLKPQGSLSAYENANANTLWLIFAAVMVVYLVLGILYESWIHPVTVISTLPSAAIGALLALKLTGTEFTLIALIGIILLIGIVKKNAIMMIDFALAGERAGKTPFDAIYSACLLRFRPIMMTTFAALLGNVPLMLATGSGAELRRPMGLVIVGGLIFSQLLTLFTTPVIYLWFERLASHFRKGKALEPEPALEEEKP